MDKDSLEFLSLRPPPPKCRLYRHFQRTGLCGQLRRLSRLSSLPSPSLLLTQDLAVRPWLPSGVWQFSCLPLPPAGIKGVYHHPWPLHRPFPIRSECPSSSTPEAPHPIQRPSPHPSLPSPTQRLSVTHHLISCLSLPSLPPSLPLLPLCAVYIAW